MLLSVFEIFISSTPALQHNHIVISSNLLVMNAHVCIYMEEQISIVS